MRPGGQVEPVGRHEVCRMHAQTRKVVMSSRNAAPALARQVIVALAVLLMLLRVARAYGEALAVTERPGAAASAAPAHVSIPHPDILALPADKGEVPESSRDGVVSTERLATSDRATPQAAVTAENGLAKGEGKEIVRRDKAGDSTGVLGKDGRIVDRRSRGSGAWGVIDLWPLLAVLVLMLGMAWVIKRYLPARRLLPGAGVIQVVARTALSPKQQIVLVRLGGRFILVGVSPERMNTLTCVDDPQQAALLMGELASTRPGSISGGFAQSIDRESKEYERFATDPALETEDQVHGLLQHVRKLAQRRPAAAGHA